MKTKLFISSSEIITNDFQAFCDTHKIVLSAQSLIDFVPVDFNVDEEFEVVFFSSPRSVKFFLEHYKRRGFLSAAIGDATKRTIETFGLNCDFVGSTSGKPEQVALEFKSWLENRKVLFPLSGSSNRSVSKQLEPQQKVEITVYDTVLKPLEFEDFDILVFTSPSNLRSYLEVNEISNDAKCIAWGDTTANALLENGIAVHHVLTKSELSELQNYLLTFI